MPGGLVSWGCAQTALWGAGPRARGSGRWCREAPGRGRRADGAAPHATHPTAGFLNGLPRWEPRLLWILKQNETGRDKSKTKTKMYRNTDGSHPGKEGTWVFSAYDLLQGSFTSPRYLLLKTKKRFPQYCSYFLSKQSITGLIQSTIFSQIIKKCSSKIAAYGRIV